RSGTYETVRKITNHKLIRYTNKICRLVCSGSLESVTSLIRKDARPLHHLPHCGNENLSTIYAVFDWMSLVDKGGPMHSTSLASEPNNKDQILLKDVAVQKNVYAAGVTVGLYCNRLETHCNRFLD
ncbi:hypothetical protein KRM18_21110, partial [Xanthomonas hortorum pv. gardneri]